MKVNYDDTVDALYIQLGNATPDGAVEITDGVNVDTSPTGEIIGIEILNASTRLDLKTIFSYSLDLDTDITALKTP